MMNNQILFATQVIPQEGTPYLASKQKVQLFMTRDEIRLIDPLWTYTIPLQRIYECTAKPLPEKKVVYATFSAPSTIEVMNNYVIIDYLNESNQRNVLRAIIYRYFWIKSNVAEAIRFNDTIEKYQLRDKFIKDSLPTD